MKSQYSHSRRLEKAHGSVSEYLLKEISPLLIPLGLLNDTSTTREGVLLHLENAALIMSEAS